jgi:D-serine deaminase-like pyridoxal phosphate-dependent protein
MDGLLGYNKALIGQEHSRRRLNTPALLIDIEALDRNIARMAETVAAAGRALRPHAKTHKSAEVARRQVAAGAVGICCATLGEAEAMADAGIYGILVTSPVVTPRMIERLMAVHARSEDMMVVVDHPANVELLDGAAAVAGKPLSVLVDFDVGLARTGVADAPTALAVARLVSESANLNFAGIQAYYGHLQHIPDYAERAEKAREQSARIVALCETLREADLAPGIVSGGGTGTHHMDLSEGPFTELQAGSYVFMDQDYNRIALAPDAPAPFETSLFVQATVVSASHPGAAIIDAGLKSLATDVGTPEVVAGAPPGASYGFKGDEHGRIAYDARDNRGLTVGDVVELITPHCDPTVNLHDAYHCVRGDELVDIWPIDARGH